MSIQYPDTISFTTLMSDDQIDALREAITDVERITALERECRELRDENAALFRLAAFADHCRSSCASRRWTVDPHHNGLVSVGPAPCDCGYVRAELCARVAVAKAARRLPHG